MREFHESGEQISISFSPGAQLPRLGGLLGTWGSRAEMRGVPGAPLSALRSEEQRSECLEMSLKSPSAATAS